MGSKRRLIARVGLVAALLGTLVASGNAPEAPAENAWQDLFNGSDLDGWEPVGGQQGSWFVEDGILYTNGADGGGWLSTTDEYANFELEVEFQVPEGGNSGVFVRAPRDGNPAFAGMEVQVLDDSAEKYADLKPWQYCGSLYAVAAPSARVSKAPGEWQSLRIRCEDRVVTVSLNGTEISRTDLEAYVLEKGLEILQDHPGLRRDAGYVGLQNHGARVGFRRIAIREF